jgi:hypothetical protein
VSVGAPLVFDHDADDRDAVRRSTEVMMRSIEGLVEQSAQRLLDASWPLRAAAGARADGTPLRRQ